MRKKPNNPRQISKIEYARLQADLERFGDLGGIVHNATTDNLVGGNQRASVFDLVGKGAEIVITEEYDPLTRTGTAARGYVLWNGEKYDYRCVVWDTETEDAACITANLRGGSWDFDIMVGFDVGLLKERGFDAGLLAEWNDQNANLALMLEAEKDAPPDDPGAQVDKAEELQEKWQVKAGDVWHIGKHLLLCGDSTGDVSALGELPVNLFYDPPWDLELEKPTVFDSVLAFCDGGRAKQIVEMFGAPTWVFTWDCQGNSFVSWTRPMRRAKYAFWYGDIMNFNLKGAFWGEPEEPCMKTSNYDGSRYQFIPDNRGKHFADLFREAIGTLHNKGLHNHEKPLDWVRLLVGDCFSGCVYDPFIGSGTTMVACEQLGRRCVGAEIEPRFVALTLQRLCDMGLEPRLERTL